MGKHCFPRTIHCSDILVREKLSQTVGAWQFTAISIALQRMKQEDHSGLRSAWPDSEILFERGGK